MCDAADDLEAARGAANDLADIIGQLDALNLNPLVDEEIRTVLDSKEELREVCQRLRHTQNWMEDYDE